MSRHKPQLGMLDAGEERLEVHDLPPDEASAISLAPPVGYRQQGSLHEVRARHILKIIERTELAITIAKTSPSRRKVP
jgi:hypothetical protein